MNGMGGASMLAMPREPRRVDPAAGAAIRVLCVDDHGLVLEGMRAHFSATAVESPGASRRIEMVGELSSADRLDEVVRELRPDIVLMDIEMPGADAFEMADRVARSHQSCRVIFLSAHSREAYARTAYKCGAYGYLSKADHPRELSDAIRTVARSPKGTFVLGPSVRDCCALHQRDIACAPRTWMDALSSRETEVLRLIGKGLSRTEIAHQLCRSAKTIDGHQERIQRKLGIATRADLIRFAIREGLAVA